MRVARLLAVLLLVANWSPLALAQAPYPPNALRPYRGGANCVQVADSNGFFNCAAKTTVDPTTGNLNIGGVLSFSGISGTTTQQFPGAVVIDTPISGGPAPVALGNDLVLGSNRYTQVAPTGPDLAMTATFRLRPSQTTPGSCNVVVIAGNSFGQRLEFPIALVNPAFSFYQVPGTQTMPGGPLYNAVTIDVAGGLGC